MQILTGHDSPATAYAVDDYPYGFRLRTQIRYWVETKEREGQRFVSQTLNPKTGRWNNPKASTYSAIVIMFRDSNGHVSHDGLSWSAWADHLADFERMYGDALADDSRSREIIRHMHARHRAEQQVTYSIHTCGTGKPCDRPDLHEKPYRERLKEEAAIMHSLTNQELWRETQAAIRGEVYP